MRPTRPSSAARACCCISTSPTSTARVATAVEAGATLVRQPEDQFYGDRAAMIVDPFGHHWSLHTHIRDVSPEEMAEAAAAMAEE